MDRIAFRGRVLPQPVEITLDSVPRINAYSELAKVNMAITIVVMRSAIEVIIDTDEYRDSDFIEYYKRAFDLSQAAINIVAFSTGLGLTVYFDFMQRPDGTFLHVPFQNPYLLGVSTSFNFPVITEKDRVDFGKMLSVVFVEPALFMALDDAIKALSVLHHAPTNCGRVIDGLKKINAPDIEPKKGWKMLHEVVNCDETYMQWVSKMSTNPRHGDRSFITGADTTEAITRTWKIMNRFLEYRKRGNTPLPLDEFPLMTG